MDFPGNCFDKEKWDSTLIATLKDAKDFCKNHSFCGRTIKDIRFIGRLYHSNILIF